MGDWGWPPTWHASWRMYGQAGGAEGSAEAEALAVRADVTDGIQARASAVAALVVLDAWRKSGLVGVGFAHATF